MSETVDHYGPQYSNFAKKLYQEIRLETFGNDFGQNGWISAEEQDLYIEWLNLNNGSKLLDIACGSGGPTLRIAQKSGCTVTGVDIHKDAIIAANNQANSTGLSHQANFIQVDAGINLPFEDEYFDAVMCIDAINHLPNRLEILGEWHRILKPNGKVLFTDPITVTGILSKEDIEIRASIGYFLFAADGADERLLKKAGFKIIHKVDRTPNMADTAYRWKEARDKRSNALIQVEGQKDFEGQQVFFKKCFELAESKNLSRFAFLAMKK